MIKNQWATFSGQELVSAYTLEGDTLGALAMTGTFEGVIQEFSDYNGYLKRLKSASGHVSAVMSDDGVVNIGVPSKELVLLLCRAQIAACAELFKGWDIPEEQLTRDGMRLLIEKSTASLIKIPNVPTNVPPEELDDGQRQILSAVNVLQNADTVRVVQIVKLLGLFSTPYRDIQQLSLGVGNGYRDLYGMHISPKVIRSKFPEKTYFFDTLERQAAHTVLIDSDPAQQEHFYQLNSRERGKVLALNGDANESLEQLREMQERSQLRLRNLVVCLRVDHRMIPNSEKFLGQIAQVVAEKADLVMTIGAGHNLSEFEGRLKCFDDLINLLKGVGLKPVRILLHKGGSSEEKRRAPAFGQLAYTSYQVLYCRLHRDDLEKVASL